MNFFLFSSLKARRTLKQAYSLYKKKGYSLSHAKREEFETLLENLDQALLEKDSKRAKKLAAEVDKFVKAYFPKNAKDHFFEVAGALIFAIVVAFAIRQFWFELYEVPTGSMRPTVKEQDRLVVSKTTFGLNPPFQNRLALFEPSYVKRNGIFVFSVENMDVADADTTYFYLFPGKKRYIKRCLGKAGDTLYFYGGNVYGIDHEGNPLTEFDEQILKNLHIEKIDHIPFITFDGKVKLEGKPFHGVYPTVSISQMNIPVGKFKISPLGEVEGLFFNGKEWRKDRPSQLKSPHRQPESYSDLWGMGNYAMARLLNRTELQAYTNYNGPINEDDLLFLELRHTPNLSYPPPLFIRDEQGLHPTINSFSTVIPLQKRHLEALQKNMYTARFYVKNGAAHRYHETSYNPQNPEYDVLFPNVPNGLYEFYYGKAYSIGFGGITKELSKDHPLYNSSSEMIQKLFNSGINFNVVFRPIAANQPYNPQRFAYFRNGELFVMGGSVFTKDDPLLLEFIKKEEEREQKSTKNHPYVAFKDHGPPLKDGKLDVEFIKAFGLKIPEKFYLALGDNYAMSADSRDFGFVPENNLRGAPSFVFWPLGSRSGTLPQPSYPWFTIPNLLVWSAVIIILILYTIYWSYKRSRPIYRKIDFKQKRETY